MKIFRSVEGIPEGSPSSVTLGTFDGLHVGHQQIIDELVEFAPPFIDVTSHAADIYVVEDGQGVRRKQVRRKRPGTIGLCAAIQYRYGVEAVPHLLCRGFTQQETEDALIELNYLGIDNVLAIRGDETNHEKQNQSGRTTNESALDLVKQIQEMNQGVYLEEILNGSFQSVHQGNHTVFSSLQGE